MRAVVTFQPQLASMVIGTSGPATSRTASTRARSPARSSPTFTFRHRTPQLRNCSASERTRGRSKAPIIILVGIMSRTLPPRSW